MRRTMFPATLLLAGLLLQVWPIHQAQAQATAPAAPQVPGGQDGLLAPPADEARPEPLPSDRGQAGAQQVVGLFMATCLQHAGDIAGLRGWLAQQGARQMPPQARDLFLDHRAGQVFDTSYQTVRLAVVSLDNGGCEAITEFADAAQVAGQLDAAMRQAGVALAARGETVDKQRPGVRRQAWQVSVARRDWLLDVVSAPNPPQAAIGLYPRVAAPH